VRFVLFPAFSAQHSAKSQKPNAGIAGWCRKDSETNDEQTVNDRMSAILKRSDFSPIVQK
jgi:hypothetical protein